MNIIIDGNNLAYRCHWIASSGKTYNKTIDEKGFETTTAFMFLNSVKSFANLFNSNSIYVIWDKKIKSNIPNFRKELTQGEYKSNRKYDNVDPLFHQIDIIDETLPTLGIKKMCPYIMEGDDVIAYLVQSSKKNNIIISVDHDLLQLITPTTSFYDLNKKKIIDHNNFEEEFNIKLNNFLRYKAILGDNGDNIKGLKGYGEVNSKKIVENWTNNGLTNEQLKIVEQNIKLMDLSYGYTVYPEEVQSYIQQLNDQTKIIFNIDKFKEQCKKYGFLTNLENVKIWIKIFGQKNTLELLSS